MTAGQAHTLHFTFADAARVAAISSKASGERWAVTARCAFTSGYGRPTYATRRTYSVYL